MKFPFYLAKLNSCLIKNCSFIIIMSNISSSDNDCYEKFVSSIRKSNKVEKFRLSTGSLNDFITDNSFNEDYEDISKAISFCKEDLNRTSFDCESKTEINHEVLKIKSVATPRHPIIFSSDSDDNVFLSAALKENFSHISKSCISIQSKYRFTDSDQEDTFDAKYVKPQKLNFLDEDESQDFNSNINCIDKTTSSSVLLTNSAKNTSQESTEQAEDKTKNNFLSLSERLSHRTIPSKNNHLKKPKHSVVLPLTPISNCGNKQFHTEKINRQKHKACLVKDCFLSSLVFFTPQNSGTQFKKYKSDLTIRLFKLFNSTVFDNLLPETMEITWSKRMTKTAGITKCKRILKTLLDKSGNFVSLYTYEASIMLSEKILDHAVRLRDTLIHELCHAAVWVLNNASESHGPLWKSWAAKAQRIHPELPLIERCHNYDIHYKYRYQCTRY